MTHDDLLDASLQSVTEAARSVRDAAFGTRVTYSPSIDLVLDDVVEARLGPVGASGRPGGVRPAGTALDAVLEIARAGARDGAHEAVLHLRDRPGAGPGATGEADDGLARGAAMAAVLAAARTVLDETGLLPHASVAATRGELAQLRIAAPSQGTVIGDEQLADGEERPAAEGDWRERLLAAGALSVPYTLTLVVGGGQSRSARLQALSFIADAHRQHGHVQQVAVRVQGTPTEVSTPAGGPTLREEQLWTVAAARLTLPAAVHVQATPLCSDDVLALLDAGIDDWGSLSPEGRRSAAPAALPVAQVERLADRHGWTLAPRLTVHPEFALDPGRWLDPSLHHAVLDRSDAEGLARDDPGAHVREDVRPAASVGDGAEVVLVGRRSTAWYSGGGGAPTELVPGRPRAGGAVAEVIRGVELGQEPGVDELVTLFAARGREVAAVAALADSLRREAVGDVVTWVHNCNINYTNVCTFKCRFCGFSKGPLSLNLRGKPYLLGLDDIAEKVRDAWQLGAREVTLQGGIHPSFDGDYYVDVCRTVVEAVPGMHVHGFTALEVTEGARRLGEPLAEYLGRLREAGLGSLPGTAAEILDDEVRADLCPDKISTEEWLYAHETAHRVGLRSNVTIMHGSIEAPVHWARHLVRTRDLQRRTGGFTEFVPLPFVHMASPIYLQGKARRGPTFREVVLMHAVGRIAYRGLIDNVQASWVKLGVPGLRQLLQAGVNDLGGTLLHENISRAAGATHGQGLEPEEFAAIVEPLGRPLAQRTTLYERAAASVGQGAL